MILFSSFIRFNEVFRLKVFDKYQIGVLNIRIYVDFHDFLIRYFSFFFFIVYIYFFFMSIFDIVSIIIKDNF